MAEDTQTSSKGVSLAKGPVAIIGLIGLVYGVSALILGGHGFALHIPHGAVHGKKWIGLEVNGWSGLLFIVAGLLLLLAAPLHWGAKSMSLLVGLVLGAAAVIAVIRGNGVFGIFAANHLTELVWGAAALLLILLALLPRVGGSTNSDDRSEPIQRRRRVGVAEEGAAKTTSPRRTRVVARDAERGLVEQDVEESPRPAGARRRDTNESQ